MGHDAVYLTNRALSNQAADRAIERVPGAGVVGGDRNAVLPERLDHAVRLGKTLGDRLLHEDRFDALRRVRRNFEMLSEAGLFR